MSRSRNLADLLDANGDVKDGALDNVPPNTALVDSSDNTVLDTSTGNVGIGTSSPAKDLHISFSDSTTTNLNSGAGIQINNTNTATGTLAPLLFSTDSGGRPRSAIAHVDTGNYGKGDLAFYTMSDGDISSAVLDTGNEAMRIDYSGNLKFNSGYGSAATAYGVRAWVSFNGQSVGTIYGSGNVSSITDHGTGRYYANFTTAMPDGNYSVSAVASGVYNGTVVSLSSSTGGDWTTRNYSTYVGFSCRGNGSSYSTNDPNLVNLQIVR